MPIMAKSLNCVFHPIAKNPILVNCDPVYMNDEYAVLENNTLRKVFQFTIKRAEKAESLYVGSVKPIYNPTKPLTLITFEEGKSNGAITGESEFEIWKRVSSKLYSSRNRKVLINYPSQEFEKQPGGDYVSTLIKQYSKKAVEFFQSFFLPEEDYLPANN